MSAIIGIPSSRVSDLLIHQRITNQILSDQIGLLQVQTQLSTGQRIQLPSEDVGAAQRIIRIQRLLEQKQQAQRNVSAGQSVLAATDSALSSVADLLAEARGVALGVVSSVVSDEERHAAALQIQETISRLIDAGNTKYGDRYLFAGSGTANVPFESIGANLVSYLGDENRLSSYGDIGLLLDTNLNGAEVFGAISEPVGTADLDPALTLDTRLSDLRGGLGITRGSIALSDGTTTHTIDLTTAETIGDVARLIRAGAGTIDFDIEITPTRLSIEGGPGTWLTVREVGSGTTASELGILATNPTTSIAGGDLDPALGRTTRLDDLLGRRSYAVARSSGTDNSLIFEADEAGEAANGIKIVFSDDGSVVMPGVDEVASYDPGSRTLTVTVKTGKTEARYVVAAVERACALGTVPITARLDPLDSQNGGQGIVDATPPGDVAAETAGGTDAAFDKSAGLQIVNGGATHVVSLADAETVEDLLNALSAPELGLLAQINSSGTGIDVRSRISGADFAIGENGGATATQLGLRTFTAETRLEDLNYGRGVTDSDGTDFTITLADGTEIGVDVAGLETIGEVLDQINAAGGGSIVARLATFGNGIELADLSSGTGSLTVARDLPSTAAIELGLVAKGQDSVAADASQVLTGSDTHPLETDGIFTALTRLHAALTENDLPGIERAIEMLDQQTVELGFSRAELGAREQRLDAVQTRLESEDVDLRAVLSEDLDADLVEVISDFAARQAALEASMECAASMFQLSLLDYL